MRMQDLDPRPVYRDRQVNAIVELCRATRVRFDFSSWSDDDLKQFFEVYCEKAMKGERITENISLDVGALLFDGCESEDDIDERVHNGGGHVGDARPSSSGMSRSTASDQLQDEMHRAQAVYDALVLEQEPEPEADPPKERELEEMLEQAATGQGWHTPTRSSRVGSLDTVAEGNHARASRQKYGPNGEPLRLLASAVAAAEFGRGGAEDEPRGYGQMRAARPMSSAGEMSEDAPMPTALDDHHPGADVAFDEDGDGERLRMGGWSYQSNGSTLSGVGMGAAVASERSTVWRQVSGVVSQFEIARNGQFTCPVGCGAVFISPGPPDELLPDIPPALAAACIKTDGIGSTLSSNPTAAAVGSWVASTLRDQSCTALDSIETLEQLEEAAAAGRVPPIACVHHLRGGVVAEFVPTRPGPTHWGGGTTWERGGVGGRTVAGGNFAPVAWFKFTPRRELLPDVRYDPYSDLLVVELERLRWGRLVCVKLIACENLMEEWDDFHDAPNVDCRKVVLHGVPVTLGDYLDQDDYPLDEDDGVIDRDAEGGNGGGGGGLLGMFHFDH